jgi:hypothetical protein
MEEAMWDTNVDWRIILRFIFRKWHVTAWLAFIGLRIVISDGLLLTL